MTRSAVIATASLLLFCCAEPVATGNLSQSAQPAQEFESVTTPSGNPKHTNRLAHETSPYLLQHAHNPVDWYPWGEEALAKAKSENKPIFLSIGYSACHWCHVMERESFENETIAAVLNKHFVSIKVDREERPDLDEIYMAAVQAMTGSGGWPMTVFLTPDLKPFYGGTYFPPDNRYGRPGFKAVIERVAQVWAENPDEVTAGAERLAGHMTEILAGLPAAHGALEPEMISKVATELEATFDARDGGWGSAPKFPSSATIELLLREYARTGDSKTLEMAAVTLDKMAHGGMYDHIAGGFARYSVDAKWLVPHFEKMLYDNAQLAQCYLEAWQLTKKPLYRRVVEETLGYILRYMTDASGGFYSAEDADSEGQEGKFYIWEHAEIMDILGPEDGALYCEYYNIRKSGNFDSHEPYHKGENIVHMVKTLEEHAAARGEAPDALLARIRSLNAKMLAERDKRVRPGLDDKILTAWNGLMISAFARAAQAFDDPRYQAAAVKAARFVREQMTDANGELFRTHRRGESRLPAYLEDYSFMLLALVDVYEATFDTAWLDEADRLTGVMLQKFWDEESASFYFTSEDHTNLLVRTRPTWDGATPSGASVAALALLRLAKLLDKPEYYRVAEKMLQANHTLLSRMGRGHLKMLAAVDFLLYPPKEIAIVGDPASDGVDALLDALQSRYVPNKVVALLDPKADEAAVSKRVPLLAGKKPVDGKPAAYVCKDFACKQPVTEPAALLEQLGVSP